MDKQSTKPKGRSITFQRIRLSLLLGASLTILFGLMLSFVPFSIGKILFWPALFFVTVYDEQMGAYFYYLVGLPLAIPAYALPIYVCLALMRLPRPKDKSVEAQEQ